MRSLGSVPGGRLIGVYRKQPSGTPKCGHDPLRTSVSFNPNSCFAKGVENALDVFQSGFTREIDDLATVGSWLVGQEHFRSLVRANDSDGLTALLAGVKAMAPGIPHLEVRDDK